MLNCLWLFSKPEDPVIIFPLGNTSYSCCQKHQPCALWLFAKLRLCSWPSGDPKAVVRWSFFNFNYELLEKPAANGNPFDWRLAHRLCCDYNDFFERWPQDCGLSCGVLQGLCANLFSLTETHVIANHRTLKQSCRSHALYYTITSLTYRAWSFPQVIIFHLLIFAVLTKDWCIWSRLPGSSFSDLLPPSVSLLFNHEPKWKTQALNYSKNSTQSQSIQHYLIRGLTLISIKEYILAFMFLWVDIIPVYMLILHVILHIYESVNESWCYNHLLDG